MKRIKIHKEGHWILVFVFLLLVGLNYLICPHLSKPIFATSLVISTAIFLFFSYFFRNPTREVDIDDENLIIAPADGRIVVIEPVEENEYFHEKKLQISIFMSVFSVHANWYPIRGKVLKSEHHKGRHMAAYLPKSSTENERSTVVIETQNKTQILLRQIAGALARRIVTYAYKGKECNINEQLGFIKFGSRVDIFLPLDSEVYVQMGDKTTGNETILARIPQ